MKMRKRLWYAIAACGLAVTLGVSGCSGGGSGTPTTTPTVSCDSLVGLQIAAADIGLSTTGAEITAASLVAAADGNAGIEYCLVTGAIHPVSVSEILYEGTADEVEIPTPDINFQVALPTDWNFKTLQVGGGGFDGTIPAVDGTFEGGISSPLSRGYVTLASDSGHKAPYAGGAPNVLWNEESLKNFGREQIKKTHDAAIAIIGEYYDDTPDYNYFMGGSQGGHEALIAAEFYGEDYDGVVAGYPAYDLEAMHTGAMDQARALYLAHPAIDNSAADGYSYAAAAGEGWISRDQSVAFSTYLIEACDFDSLGVNGGVALDGAADGIISDSGECHQFLTAQGYDLLAHDDTNPLRSGSAVNALGANALTDAQIETLTKITSRYNLPVAAGVTPMTLNGGVVSYGGWPFLDGILFTNADYSGLGDLADFTISGYEDFGGYDNMADAIANGNDLAFQGKFPSQDQYNIITRKAVSPDWPTAFAAFLPELDAGDWNSRINDLSSWLDTSEVDYTDFRAHGGKIIHYHGASDTSITPYNSIDLYTRITGQFVSGDNDYLSQNNFWMSDDNVTNAAVSQNALIAAYNDGVVDSFYSFYLIPGYGHHKGYYNAAVDWLAALEDWCENDVAPLNTMVSNDFSGNGLGERPLCTFPYYPKFVDTNADGDTTSAENYECTLLTRYADLVH